MNIIYLKNKCSETPTARQLKDRRRNPFPYGSKEWRDFIDDNGLAVSHIDRRVKDRRSNEIPPQETGGNGPEKPYVRILLTPAERKLLEDVFLSELE